MSGNSLPHLEPYEIIFGAIGKPAEGYITVADLQKKIPFEVKRIFWTYYTPQDITRGRHAHYQTEMVLVAVSGRILLHTELANGNKDLFILDSPQTGVYIPPMCWHVMEYSHSAVQVVLASTTYQPEDYIRDYELFRQLGR